MSVSKAYLGIPIEIRIQCPLFVGRERRLNLTVLRMTPQTGGPVSQKMLHVKEPPLFQVPYAPIKVLSFASLH